MALEEKLNQIIEILLRIEGKIDSTQVKNIIEEIRSPEIKKINKPTRSQLDFQRQMEFSVRLSRTHFLTAIRRGAVNFVNNENRDVRFEFASGPHILSLIDEKIAKTSAQFYKDLRIQIERNIKAVEYEGEKTLERAVGRLKARAK